MFHTGLDLHQLGQINESNSLENVSRCPQTFNCSAYDDLTSFDIGTAPTYVSIISSSLSCAGSLLILIAYWLLKEMRNLAQKIITLLAIADLITASGYLLAGWNFLSHFNQTDHDECAVFQSVCKIQSFVTTWSTLCSFAWTVALGLHFYLILHFYKQQTMTRILIAENILIWLLPLVIVIPLLATKKLGYTRYATSNWCYVTDDDDHPSSNFQNNQETIVLMLFAGNLWEMIAYIVVIIMYGITRRRFKMQVKIRVCNNSRVEQSLVKKCNSEVEHRLLLIPLVFVLLRIWGTIQFIFSVATSGDNYQHGCIPYRVQTVYNILGILQAIGDGGQGWGNAFLYIFLSSTIRQHLFSIPCIKLIQLTGERLKRVGYAMETAAGKSWKDTSFTNIPRHGLNQNRNAETDQLIVKGRVVRYNNADCTSAAPSMFDRATPGPISSAAPSMFDQATPGPISLAAPSIVSQATPGPISTAAHSMLDEAAPGPISEPRKA